MSSNDAEDFKQFRLKTEKGFKMSNWDYDKEYDNFRDACDRGEDAFTEYMCERFDDPDFDWDRWDVETGDGD